MEQRLANERMVSDAYAALAKSDLDRFLEAFHPEARLLHADSLPFGGVYAGTEQIRRGLEWQRAAFDDWSFRVEQLTSWGERVIAYLAVCGRAAATGQSFAFPAAESWRLRDGKAVELRIHYWDTHRLRRCLMAA